MGGLGFGQGYFGEYSTGGTTPPDFPVQADYIIGVRADVGVIEVRADVGVVEVE
jgi:hypothetical protein